MWEREYGFALRERSSGGEPRSRREPRSGAVARSPSLPASRSEGVRGSAVELRWLAMLVREKRSPQSARLQRDRFGPRWSPRGGTPGGFMTPPALAEMSSSGRALGSVAARWWRREPESANSCTWLPRTVDPCPARSSAPEQLSGPECGYAAVLPRSGRERPLGRGLWSSVVPVPLLVPVRSSGPELGSGVMRESLRARRYRLVPGSAVDGSIPLRSRLAGEPLRGPIPIDRRRQAWVSVVNVPKHVRRLRFDVGVRVRRCGQSRLLAPQEVTDLVLDGVPRRFLVRATGP